MCGANNRSESDRHPLWMCAECMPKVCLATGADPVKRYEKLLAYCRREGFRREVRFYEKALAVLTEERRR